MALWLPFAIFAVGVVGTGSILWVSRGGVDWVSPS